MRGEGGSANLTPSSRPASSSSPRSAIASSGMLERRAEKRARQVERYGALFNSPKMCNLKGELLGYMSDVEWASILKLPSTQPRAFGYVVCRAWVCEGCPLYSCVASTDPEPSRLKYCILHCSAPCALVRRVYGPAGKMLVARWRWERLKCPVGKEQTYMGRSARSRC